MDRRNAVASILAALAVAILAAPVSVGARDELCGGDHAAIARPRAELHGQPVQNLNASGRG